MTNSRLNFRNWQTVFMITILFSFFIAGCSKDDNSSQSEPIELNGGDIFRYQIVQIDLPGIELEQNEYEATLGDVTVTVFKTDVFQLAFAVPIDFPLETTELLIPNLNNAKIIYNVLEPELTQTIEETIEPMFSLCETHFSELENPSIEDNKAQSAFEQFQQYFETLSIEEKERVALYYKVNKQAIDNVILLNGGNTADRLTMNDAALIIKFGLAVAVTAAGAIGIVYGDPGLKAVGAVIALLGASEAVKCQEKIQERQIKVLNFEINGDFGINERSMENNGISLFDDTDTTVSFQLVERPLIQSDKNTTNTDILKYFSAQSSYNNFVQKANIVIEWVNNNTFMTFNTIDLVELISDPEPTQSPVAENMMNDIDFNINHPNLQLIDASLSSTGELNLKVKITGNPSTYPVESTLNYTYNDDFSSFSGHFDIEVSTFSLAGDWEVIDYSDSYGNLLNNWGYHLYGSIYCPNLWTLREMIIINPSPSVFDSNSFVILLSKVTEERVIPNSECQPEPITSYSYDSTFAGYYTAPQDNIIPVTTGSEECDGYFEIIDDDTIIYHLNCDYPSSYTITLSRL